MTVTFALNGRDAQRIYRYMLLHRETLLMNVFTISAVTFALDWLLIIHDPRDKLYTLSPVVIPFCIVAMLVAIDSQQRKRLPDDPGPEADITLTLLPEGVHEHACTYDTFFHWGRFTRVSPTRRYLYLFTDCGVVHVVPTRAFASKEAAQEFADAALWYWQHRDAPSTAPRPAQERPA